jgi:hypothetical protein
VQTTRHPHALFTYDEHASVALVPVYRYAGLYPLTLVCAAVTLANSSLRTIVSTNQIT